MEYLKGIVERITYSNSENGFSVIRLKTENKDELVTIVGILPSLNPGTQLMLKGDWKTDNKYGKQFSVKSYKELMPSTLTGIEKYLGSGLIKGIGPVYAKKIVKKFGLSTIEIIEKTPDRLSEIEGIGEKRLEMIKSGWEEQKEIKNVMIFLQSHGISTTFAVKIFKRYGKKSVDVLKENPYRLADDIWGIGFKSADKIAENMGFEPFSYSRCRSGFFYILNEASNNGHCYLTKEEMIEEAQKLLDIDEEAINDHLLTAVKDESLINDNGCIYLPPILFSEIAVSKRIKEISNTPGIYSSSGVKEVIKKIENEEKISYDLIQKEAIEKVVQSKFIVLTGGPGTGKTTTTLGIIKVFQQMGAEVVLAAPTGRAAKRLSETTRMEAKTIHRLLEFKPGEGYKKNSENPLKGDILIIDEFSMIDLLLMHNLLKAVPVTMNILLVGDIDQLPSVGAGNVLKDIINSKKIEVVKLERIFRQAENSEIIMNAHRINKGLFPELKSNKESDFFFIQEEDPEKVVEIINDLCTRRIPKYYKVDAVNDIQVLAPMQRGVTGAQNLNQVLQKSLNKNTQGLDQVGHSYYLGDKVMQIKNNYDKGVFNGDIGIISNINFEDKIINVQYDYTEALYESGDFDELVLAYAVTVHKSQGSEYKVVIAPLTTQHYMMLQRNLLYTCVTRAKKIMILVGTKKAVFLAVKNNKITKRNTRLGEFLKK